MHQAGPTHLQQVKAWVLILLAATALCSSANGFLIAAVCAITPAKKIIDTIWNQRHLIDLCVALAVCLIPIKPAKEKPLPPVLHHAARSAAV
ncbi:MAG TPA: hypothetical protein VFE47_16470 [Tepidisphaeraceae bacterium]|jgi:hypothetical protein|nr:hypothetical protein [Tepidisphaeraceae bacterium]